MKYAILAAITVLAIVLIYLLFNNSGTELPPVNQSKITELKTNIQKAEASMKSIIVKAKNDSVKHAEVTKAQEKEILKWKRIAKQAKTPRVDTIIRENPEVGIYVQYLDSIVVSQDAEIASLKTQTSDQWQSFNELIHASDSVGEAHKALNLELQNSLDLAYKQNKKLKRQNRFLKVSIVAIPLVVVGLVVVK